MMTMTMMSSSISSVRQQQQLQQLRQQLAELCRPIIVKMRRAYAGPRRGAGVGRWISATNQLTPFSASPLPPCLCISPQSRIKRLRKHANRLCLAAPQSGCLSTFHPSSSSAMRCRLVAAWLSVKRGKSVIGRRRQLWQTVCMDGELVRNQLDSVVLVDFCWCRGLDCSCKIFDVCVAYLLPQVKTSYILATRIYQHHQQ